MEFTASEPKLYPIVAASPAPSVAAELAQIAAKLPPEDMGSEARVPFGQRRANAAALLRLGEREKALPVFAMADDPEALTQFIFRLRPRGVRVDALLESGATRSRFVVGWASSRVCRTRSRRMLLRKRWMRSGAHAKQTSVPTGHRGTGLWSWVGGATGCPRNRSGKWRRVPGYVRLTVMGATCACWTNPAGSRKTVERRFASPRFLPRVFFAPRGP